MDIFTFALLFLLVLVVGFFGAFYYFAKNHLYYTKVVTPRTLSWVFLEVQMPKEGGGKEDKSGSGPGQEERKAQISLAEQLFTTISSAADKSGGFLGSQDYLSLEIACIDKKISFYINCPKSVRELVEKQIHAQYPHAFIDEVSIYNPFREGAKVEVMELELVKNYMYPFRSYKQMESDPLNSITNAMSKLSEEDGAVVQYIIHPTDGSWQKKPRKTALEIQQGKNPDSLEKSIFSKLGSEVSKGLTSAITGGKEDDKGGKKDLSGDSGPISLTPMQQEIVKRLEEKASRPGFKTNIRILSSAKDQATAKLHLNNIASSFLQFNMPPFNSLKAVKRSKNDVVKDYIFRVFRDKRSQQILNTEELASLWHLPGSFLETPNIKWLVAKKAPPPINVPTSGVLLGRNIYRGMETKIYIDRDDRRRHMYIIGRTGVGKTEIMKNMARQDILNGEGVCIIDPHGDFIEDILPHVPKERAEDVVLFEPADMDRPMGLNMLDAPDEAQRDFAVQEMISIFYKLVTDPAMLGPMFEHYMRNAMLTLMADQDQPGTLVEIPRILTDYEFQQYKVSKVTDPILRSFWEKEMSKTDLGRSDMLGYLISKVGRFIENSMMRNIIGQGRSAFDFRKIMDEQKILLVNLSKGKVGEINAKLLGLILVSKIQMAALSRANLPESERKDFYLYVDEFQNFITDAFESILSEARKYRLNLIIAHQYLAQLESGAGVQGAGAKTLRDAVFGNAGTMVAFRIGVEDAETMAKEMAPTFNEFDLVNVERFNGFIKLMINGTASKPFNMATYPLPKPTSQQAELAKAIRQLSRLKYGRPKAEVESEIIDNARLLDMGGEPAENFDNFM